jgi:hypothetical protein
MFFFWSFFWSFFRRPAAGTGVATKKPRSLPTGASCDQQGRLSQASAKAMFLLFVMRMVFSAAWSSVLQGARSLRASATLSRRS